MGLIPLCFLSAIISLDTAAVFQVLISQPIVACTIIGWLSNDLLFGLQIGLIMQLIWISSLPIGAAMFPDGNLGSIVAVIVATQVDIEEEGFEHLIIFMAVFYGFILSFIGAHTMKLIRTWNVQLLHNLLKGLERDKLNAVGRSISLALAFNLVLLFLIILSTSYMGKIVFEEILQYIPLQWNAFARFTELAVLGAGFGLTLTLYKDGLARYLLIFGIILSIILFLV